MNDAVDEQMERLRNDPYWRATADFLKGRVVSSEMILAPAEFRRLFGHASFYFVSNYIAPESFRFVVVHKGMLDFIDPSFLHAVVPTWRPVFANEVFVVFDRNARRGGLLAGFPFGRAMRRHAVPLRDAVAALPVRAPEGPPREAILLNTYNRSWALARSLPAVVAFGRPVLVVDDGSDAAEAAVNRELCTRFGAQYLALPQNRGLPAAMNAGLAYLLADPAITWIVTLQDDVVLAPGTFEAMAAVRDERSRPILTTYVRHAAPVTPHATIAGYDVQLQVAAAGPMLYAHRDYWRGVLPIPTPYLGAPKPIGVANGGLGSDEDFWITAWAPGSAAQRRIAVACVPGVRASHLADDPALSTWRTADAGGFGALHSVDDEDMQQVFERVYERAPWGRSPDPTTAHYSGLGSHEARFVEPYVAAVREFAASTGARLNAVDLGCGDFFVGAQLRPSFTGFIACDVVAPLIAANRQRYADLDVDFRQLDLARDELPPGDVAIVRQVFQHLSNRQIARALGGIARRYKYLVLTESLPPTAGFTPNLDILSGANLRLGIGSGVDITRPPFSLEVCEVRRLCTVTTDSSIVATDLYRLA